MELKLLACVVLIELKTESMRLKLQNSNCVRNYIKSKDRKDVLHIVSVSGLGLFPVEENFSKIKDHNSDWENNLRYLL